MRNHESVGRGHGKAGNAMRRNYPKSQTLQVGAVAEGVISQLAIRQ